MSSQDAVANSENAANQALGTTAGSAGSAELPAPLRAVIATVCKRARLWKHERADVEAELAAHFRDGLAQGEATEKLLADFGDPAAAAKLIRRSKIRNRPLWWRVQHRIGQAIACLLVLMMVLAAIHTIRFYTGRPTLAFRPLDVLNKDANALSERDRAWPGYRAAYLALDLDVDQFKAVTDLEPDGRNLADVRPLLERAGASIAGIRAAAAKPGMGYIASISEDEDLAIKSAILTGSVCLVSSSPGDLKPDPENPEAIAILLSHLTPVRSCARLLRADAIAALHEDDAERLQANLLALVAIARHLRSPDTLVSSLVSVAVVGMTTDLVRDVLAMKPALLASDRLTELAHRLTALGGPTDLVSLRGERIHFLDAIQRLYTDDGNGNGRLTAGAAEYFNKISSLGGDAGSGALLLTSAVIADRKQMTQAFDAIIDRAEASLGVPLWQPLTESADSVLERYTASPVARMRYLLIAVLAPALDRARLSAHAVAQTRDATLVAIAVELYRRQTGTPPTTLAALVPAYLPSIPRDNADGAALRYRRDADSYVLYSVGSDRRDDQGTRPATDKDLKALLRMERPEPVSAPGDLIFFPRLPATSSTN